MIEISCFLPVWIARFTRSIIKIVLHWWTSKSEIERILSDERHSVDMTTELFASIAQSKVLVETKRKVLSHISLDVDDSVSEICSKKRIDSKKHLIVANARICLNSIKYVQEIDGYTQRMKQLAFDWSKNDHFDLLDKFWSRMRPGVRRSARTVCGDWGEVGFQGNDPATDFRGMGLLGLQHLVYFAGRGEGGDARRVLTDSMHPRRYFPFAATGINITAFVVELLEEFRLNTLIFARLEEGRLQNVGGEEAVAGSGFGGDLVQAGADVLSEVYCDVFTEFDALWVERDPPNVMHFRVIFNEVKDKFRMKYKSCTPPL